MMIQKMVILGNNCLINSKSFISIVYSIHRLQSVKVSREFYRQTVSGIVIESKTLLSPLLEFYILQLPVNDFLLFNV